MKKTLTILTIIMMVMSIFMIAYAQTGTFSPHNLFYKPDYGASGVLEWETYNDYIDIADNQVWANKTNIEAIDLSLYYLKTDINTQAKMEAIWGVTLATDTELAALKFTDLPDTPANYTGSANKFLQVNATPDAIIFDTIKEADISDLQLYATKSEASTVIYCNYSTGSDETGNGSAGSPYKTIQKAIDSLPDIITEDTVIAVGASETYITDATIADLQGKQVTASLTIKAMDTSDKNLYFLSAINSSTTTSLTDTDAGWTTNEWAGGVVVAFGNTSGKTELRTISSNTSDTLTISEGTAWSPNAIYLITKVKLETDYGYAFTNLPENLTIYGFHLPNHYRTINSGVGSITKTLTVSRVIFENVYTGIRLYNTSDLYCDYVHFDIYEGYGIFLYNSTVNLNYVNFYHGEAYVYGKGINASFGSLVKLYALSNAAYFDNLDIGVRIEDGSLGLNLTYGTYSGCDDNFVVLKNPPLPIITLAANTTYPHVNDGKVFVTSANTQATAITDLYMPVPGEIIILIGGSDTNSTTISDAGNFKLNGDMTLGLDDSITLFVKEDNYYIEVSRSVN